MPRPRLLPSQRQRAAEACQACRHFKKKCSGTAPCHHCLRRGIAAQCHITFARRGSRAVGLSGPDSVAGDGSMAEGEGSANGDGVQSSETGLNESVDGPLTPQAQSRMLLNSHGDRVFIGGAATISFLQLVRRLVAKQIGPSQFSHNASSERMLEKPTPLSQPLQYPHVDMAEGLSFVKCYNSVTEGLLNVLEPLETERAVMELFEPQATSPHKRAALLLVIAIGAQAKSLESAQTIGIHYFRQAQSLAFEGSLEDASLDLVRCFLLMSFFLLGECRRNTAFLYLGIAGRAAVALGLHSSESCSNASQRNVWASVCIVESLVNSILGRPGATTGTGGGLMGSCLGSPTPNSELGITLGITQIIISIVDRIYDKKDGSVAVVQALLQDIEAWADKLPQGFRVAAVKANASDEAPGGIMKSIQVSCLYYFAMTLATRPILVSHLTAASDGADEAQTQLVSTCLEAAILLTQTCVDAREMNVLPGNMCILKALVFAGGLVLGFETFVKGCKRCMDWEVERAFEAARDILQYFAVQSPQAAHYHEILSLLAKAIDKRRQDVASRRQDRCVSQIFRLQRASDDGMAESQDDWRPWIAGEETFVDWNSLDISQWDSISLGY
ncbi:hypothetical protein CDD82_5926 [Ophiocordyceps australis]|uniref:Zn(2)-C6 fungal-type domain-containing protein n=1 Tax=Ophiocordyceps australis TaxID=1399860 RepID=A0A2C5YXR4_9HYPO|nr:hypothetical protein CDD82_5926 [Ophiocordyceps australis]